MQVIWNVYFGEYEKNTTVKESESEGLPGFIIGIMVDCQDNRKG